MPVSPTPTTAPAPAFPDFLELDIASKQAPPPQHPPSFVQATDNVKLAVRIYRPTKQQQQQQQGPAPKSPASSLVFYHGGGAHSGAGYHLLARALAETYNVTVYTPDLRGHGQSGGPRGDSPSMDQVWKDIDSVIDFVLSLSSSSYDDDDDGNNNSNKGRPPPPLFLGGHSSGGGLVLNYATWEHRRHHADTIKAYLLVSPQLGYLAQVDRPISKETTPFAKVNIAPFILNGIFGWCGHNHAVQFQYPLEVLQEDPAMVTSNSVNMADAITPLSPKTQFQDLKKEDLPPPPSLALWIGQDDELFMAEKVAAFAQGQGPNMSGTVLPGKTHLGVLVDIAIVMGPWIVSCLDEDCC